MTKDDILWVAFKVLGLYFIVQGLTSLSGYALAFTSGMPIRGSIGSIAVSALVPMGIGAYLLLDGRAVLKLAAGK